MKIDSAKGYYAFLKQKGISDESDDRACIAALEDTLATHLKTADEDGLKGEARDNFFFWRGALVGQYLISRAYLQHFQKSAHEQGLKPDYDA